MEICEAFPTASPYSPTGEDREISDVLIAFKPKKIKQIESKVKTAID